MNGTKDKNGKVHGQLSANTIKHHHANIRKALQVALTDNIISSNVADRVKLPKVEQFNAKFYSAEQIQQLLDVSKNTPIATALIIASFYGLRRSELLGLKWDSIDFVQNSLKICNTITDISGTIIEKEHTKNKSSYRTLPLIPSVREHLLRELASQAEYAKTFGDCYIQNDYVCKWENGKPFSPAYISHKFKDIIKANAMPEIRFHDIRHSTASMLIANGVDIKLIQEWLGHSSVATTGNLYVHLQFSQKVVTGDMLDGLLAVNSETVENR